MRTLAGSTRCKGATGKAQLVYSVLLAIAMRPSGAKALPIQAQRRVDASPVCADWLKELERSGLREDYEGNWRDFMRILCERPPSPGVAAQAPEPTGTGLRVELPAEKRPRGVVQPRKLDFGGSEEPEASPSTASRISEATGFWPAVYVATLLLSLAVEPWAKVLSPAIATVGLLGAHAVFR